MPDQNQPNEYLRRIAEEIAEKTEGASSLPVMRAGDHEPGFNQWGSVRNRETLNFQLEGEDKLRFGQFPNTDDFTTCDPNEVSIVGFLAAVAQNRQPLRLQLELVAETIKKECHTSKLIHDMMTTPSVWEVPLESLTDEVREHLRNMPPGEVFRLSGYDFSKPLLKPGLLPTVKRVYNYDIDEVTRRREGLKALLREGGIPPLGDGAERERYARLKACNPAIDFEPALNSWSNSLPADQGRVSIAEETFQPGTEESRA